MRETASFVDGKPPPHLTPQGACRNWQVGFDATNPTRVQDSGWPTSRDTNTMMRALFCLSNLDKVLRFPSSFSPPRLFTFKATIKVYFTPSFVAASTLYTRHTSRCTVHYLSGRPFSTNLAPNYQLSASDPHHDATPPRLL
jgi:hypothetical protein